MFTYIKLTEHFFSNQIMKRNLILIYILNVLIKLEYDIKLYFSYL